jgi:hypothetical protein
LVLRRLPVFRISKPLLSKFITVSSRLGVPGRIYPRMFSETHIQQFASFPLDRLGGSQTLV